MLAKEQETTMQHAKSENHQAKTSIFILFRRFFADGGGINLPASPIFFPARRDYPRLWVEPKMLSRERHDRLRSLFSTQAKTQRLGRMRRSFAQRWV